MNDYKELIEKLEHYLHLGDAPIGRGWGALIDKQALKDAADAIEQLVKERDAALKDFLEVAQTNDSECDYCKKQYKCLGLDRGCITSKGKMECGIWRDNFEWRGVQK